MSTVDSQLVRRSVALPELVATLQHQHDARLDVVVPAAGIHSAAGVWEVEGTGHAVLGPDDVTSAPGRFAPTGTCDTAMADKLGIPTPYLRHLRAEHLDLYDANVNGWLQRQPDRRLLVRTLRGPDAGQDGIARAVLSGRYRFVDNLDVLLAVLDGIRAAGADVHVAKCDLTERRMYVQIASQSVAARAETLLSGYVSPFAGARGTDNPLPSATSAPSCGSPRTSRTRSSITTSAPASAPPAASSKPSPARPKCRTTRTSRTRWSASACGR